MYMRGGRRAHLQQNHVQDEEGVESRLGGRAHLLETKVQPLGHHIGVRAGPAHPGRRGLALKCNDDTLHENAPTGNALHPSTMMEATMVPTRIVHSKDIEIHPCSRKQNTGIESNVCTTHMHDDKSIRNPKQTREPDTRTSIANIMGRTSAQVQTTVHP